MFKITSTKHLTENVFSTEIEAPAVALDSQPGQHVEVRVGAGGDPLRLPLAAYDRDRGTVTVVYEARDRTVNPLPELAEGEAVLEVRGPLGTPCQIGELGKVVFAAEDLGVASLYLRVKEHKNKGAYTISVIGFESSADVYWEEEFLSVSDELYVCTRDGSYGVNGRIANPVGGVCETHKNIERLVAIAQLDSMKKLAKIASDYEINALVAFDAVRSYDGSTGVFEAPQVPPEISAFAAVPEVNAIEIDFDKLLARHRAVSKETAERRAPRPSS